MRMLGPRGRVVEVEVELNDVEVELNDVEVLLDVELVEVL